MIFELIRHLILPVARERVALEVEGGLEGHAALLARLVLGGVVEGGVAGQVLARLERVAAEGALEEAQLVGGVRGQVVLQRVA